MVSAGLTLTCVVLSILPPAQDPAPTDAAAVQASAQQEVRDLLALQRDALARADAEAFLRNLAPDSVVMGTAPTERFNLEQYREWSAPMFARGPRPSADVIEEHIRVSEDGRLAWFDQHTRRPQLGDMRVSGVARKSGGRWKLVQQNHSFLVPNEIVPALVDLMRETAAATGEPDATPATPSRVPSDPAVTEVQAVLDAFHRAAGEGDADAYFDCLAADAALLGTAAGERWEMPEYRARVEFLLDQGASWKSTPIALNVQVSLDGRHAWFDELVDRKGVGTMRGTGVLRREGDTWRIVHFNRTIVFANEVFRGFLKLRDAGLDAAEVVRRLLEDEEQTGSLEDLGPDVVDLSPATWPRDEFVRLMERNRVWGPPHPAARGTQGMVAGTTQVLAVRAGVEALRQGGTAMDAACTTALAQIALNAGATVSYAGILTCVYYEAASGEVHALMAPFATPLGEKMPLTIPPRGTPSGRSALVPGFMKGLEAGHQRFGKLAFGSLFTPAIFFAERGVPMEGSLEAWMHQRAEVLSRLPETRALFSGEDGGFLAHGELLRQRDLARTLRRVAVEGADHMYTGDWAQAFADAVQAEGGKITPEDLARYEVVWSEPLRITYRDREVCSVAEPLLGGRYLLESLNLLELADLRKTGRYRESAQSYYWLIQCGRMARFMRGSGAWNRLLTGEEDSDSSLSKENSRRFWDRMQDPGFLRLMQGRPPRPGHEAPRNKSGGHSDGVVAVDAAGNVAALCHTINAEIWGSTGLFVGGVSVPDSANFQQMRMMNAGPGGHVPNEMNPSIVLKDGKPVLGCSSVGRGLHEATLGCLHNVLDFGMSPDEALAEPTLMTAYYQEGKSLTEQYRQVMQKGRYPEEVLTGLEELGQETEVLEAFQASSYRGYWIGIGVDEDTGEWVGQADLTFNGGALGER